ncbi:hypothetical protein BC827DRAFT_1204968, partial [Russula dissimulans]
MVLLLALFLCKYVCFPLPSTASGLQFVTRCSCIRPQYPRVCQCIFFPLRNIYIAFTYYKPQKLLWFFLVVRM